MSWQEDLADHIVDAFMVDGVTWATGTNVVIGPPEDDDVTDDLCIGLVSRPGPIDETYGAVYGRPNLTVVVRSAVRNPKQAEEISTALFVFLTKIANATVGTTALLRLEPLAWPGRLRRDASFRTDYTSEIGVWLDEQ